MKPINIDVTGEDRRMSIDDVGVCSTVDYEIFEECDLDAMKTEEDIGNCKNN